MLYGIRSPENFSAGVFAVLIRTMSSNNYSVEDINPRPPPLNPAIKKPVIILLLNT
jgi:glycerol-3-phosphate O-acyltransferase